MPKSVLLQRTPEVGGQIGWQDALTHLIQADVLIVLLAVRLAAESPVFSLTLSQIQQQLAHRRDQRQRATAGFCFGGIGGDNGVSAVNRAAGHGVADGNGVPLEVNRVPLEAQHLASAQAIEGGELDRYLDQQAFDGAKQAGKLLLRIEAGCKGILPRTIHLVRRI